jgi:hypothetical protein
MTRVVFAGPSLRPEDRAGRPGLLWLPPVAQGDVFAAVEGGAEVIGIVDGFFEAVPAVLHKEILYALDRGVAVLGAASMGALRAAELHPFGMTGVGRVFEMFRHGSLTDDDEVAVLHGPAEAGWPVVGEAMVNVRVTLDAAVEEGVVAESAAVALAGVAKGIFYKDRSWDRILAAAEAVVDAAALAALRRWLPSGRVDQKRRDAVALLEAVAAHAPDPAARPASGAFVWTEIFNRVIRAPVQGSFGGATARADESRILDELRLDPALWREVGERALLTTLVEREAGAAVDDGAESEARTLLAERHGLSNRARRTAWAERNGLQADGLERLVRREARLLERLGEVSGRFPRALLDELRVRGLYAHFAERSAQKQTALEARGLEEATPEALAMTAAALRLWYFEQRLGIPHPDDLAAWAKRQGFAHEDDFHRVILREHLYSDASGG